MVEFLRNIKVIRKNKYEIYASFVVVIVGFLLFSTHTSVGFYDVLGGIGTSVVGFFCALNAVQDFERMNSIERLVANTWFFIVSVWAYLNLLSGLLTATFSSA